MQKLPYVFPVIGGRKVEQLYANLEALDIALAPEHIRKIESAVPFDPGFPYNWIVSEDTLEGTGYLLTGRAFPLLGRWIILHLRVR